MSEYDISEKRQKQIDEFITTPIQVGDIVYVFECDISSYSNKEKLEYCKVISLDPLTVNKCGYSTTAVIAPEKIQKRATHHVGANPFTDTGASIRDIAFTLESIVHSIDHDRGYDIKGIPIMAVNWNPFVYDITGNKRYYQRDFVWTVENKQNLIESIYNHISCGKILIRVRSFEELDKMQANGETDLAFREIVDGKQRLHTILEFINGEFPDKHGNYYADLSRNAQRHLLDHHLFGYAEMQNVSDQEVLKQFLKMNFEGVPQSTEHLNYIRELYMSGKESIC